MHGRLINEKREEKIGETVSQQRNHVYARPETARNDDFTDGKKPAVSRWGSRWDVTADETVRSCLRSQAGPRARQPAPLRSLPVAALDHPRRRAHWPAVALVRPHRCVRLPVAALARPHWLRSPSVRRLPLRLRSTLLSY